MNDSAYRLFFALWPPASVRDRLAHLSRSLPLGKAKPVPAENLHITLAFLGSADEGQRACLESLAEGIQVPPFCLALDQLGHFPRPQVLWVGCSQEPEPVFELVGELKRRLPECGFEPETRPYRTHLTLARKVRRPRLEEKHVDPIVWPVEDFCLVASETLPQGAQYAVLRRWPLSAADALEE